MDRLWLIVVRVLAGLLFFQHGAEKLWGFAGGRIDRDFSSLHGMAGPIEAVGGMLLVLGLFTRPVAFLLCGEMAVAYFRMWAPRGFFPISNGGEEAVLFCYLFLWMVTTGGGSWSADSLIAAKEPGLYARLSSWETYALALTRFVFGFTFALHGFRLALGVLPAAAGRRGAAPMALDQLPSVFGYLVIAAGLLMMLGLFPRPVGLISAALALAAYLHSAAPRGVWPIRNGGTEALLYVLVFAYVGIASAGGCSLDAYFKRRVSNRSTESAPLPR